VSNKLEHFYLPTKCPISIPAIIIQVISTIEIKNKLHLRFCILFFSINYSLRPLGHGGKLNRLAPGGKRSYLGGEKYSVPFWLSCDIKILAFILDGAGNRIHLPTTSHSTAGSSIRERRYRIGNNA